MLTKCTRSQSDVEQSQYSIHCICRDRHEALKPKTETFTSRDQDETETLASSAETRPRRDICRSRDMTRDVKIGLHIIMIAVVNLFSRPLGIIIIHNVNLWGAITWSLLQINIACTIWLKITSWAWDINSRDWDETEISTSRDRDFIIFYQDETLMHLETISRCINVSSW